MAGSTGLRIGATPQRRTACRCDARRLCLHPDVLQYLPDIGTVRDEGLQRWSLNNATTLSGA